MKERIEAILNKHPQKSRDNLLPILQEIHDSVGYLTEEALIEVSKHLEIPVSKIYGVSTFFDQFKFKPNGKNHIQLCNGTSCHINKGNILIQEIENILQIKNGDTTKDGLFSLELKDCLGACHLGPIVKINNDIYTKVSVKDIIEIIDTLKIKED
jgi:NADH:ubiquinone oxidoreductase subunit E